MLSVRWILVIIQRVFYVLTAGEWPPFASVAVVVRDGEKVLMIQRSDGQGYGLPGGYIKLHEKCEDAGVREVREETGYEVELTRIAGILSGVRKGTYVRALDVVYEAKIVGGDLRPSLEGEGMWVNPDEVRDQIAFDYVEILDKLAAESPL